MRISKVFSQCVLTGACLSLFGSVIPVVSMAGQTTDQSEQTTSQATSSVDLKVDRYILTMGTLVSAKLYGTSRDELVRYATLLEGELTKYDDMMSVHKPTALNDVNSRSGQTVEIPKKVALMVKEAFAIADETNGAFEPMIGPVVNLWKIGFGGDQVPSDEAIEAAVRLVDRNRVRLWEEGDRWFMRIDAGQSIDMGAIAKGYIGTLVADALKDAGMKRGLLDLGGNVVAIGDNFGKPWRIGIQHPIKDRGGYFGVVNAKEVSVVTSGAYERYFEKDGKRYAHILDPKTGRPVETDMASVTIIDPNGARADALCTALFGMGWARAQTFLKAHSEIKAVLMHGDMQRVAITATAQPIVTIVDEKLKTTVIE